MSNKLIKYNDKMESLINIVNKHKNNRHEKNFTFNEGKIIFFYDDTCQTNCIYVHGFWLNKEYQRLGILTNFLTYLSNQFDEIWIFQANFLMSCILLTTQIDGKYFINNYTGEHYWKKYNNNYDHEKALNIANILKPVKVKLYEGKKTVPTEIRQLL